MKAVLALITISTVGLLLGPPAALGLDPSLETSQYAHPVTIRLPLIEGKDIRFTHYSQEQGLSENRVDHLLQDAQGFLWIGTYNGLNRFDGYRFQTYKPEPNNPNSLGGVMIYSLFQDRSGVLWIGVDQGLDRFDPVTRKFTHFYSNASDPGSLSGHVENITQDRDGMLWLATHGGLDRLDPVSLRFTHYRSDPKDPRTLASDDTQFVLEDREGTLWVATAAGPDAFDRRTGKVIRHYPSSRQPPLDRIYEDRSGTLWLSATRRGGITSLDRKTGVFTTYIFFDEWPEATGTRGCSAILEDRRGMLWLATNPDGVVRFDRRRREFTRYRTDPADPASLNGNGALSLIEDREGGMWVGTENGGVSRFPSVPSPFTIYRSGVNPGIQTAWIRTVYSRSLKTVEPPRQVHWLVEGVNSQKSFNCLILPAASNPKPPNSHRFPLLSIQVLGPRRLPGLLPGAGVPNCAYTPRWPQSAPRLEFGFPVQETLRSLLSPLIHAHRRVEASNRHRLSK